MIILTSVIIAPVMEELVFRKYLVDRLVPYGQKTAVVLSGLFFGLFHGNFISFLCGNPWRGLCLDVQHDRTHPLQYCHAYADQSSGRSFACGIIQKLRCGKSVRISWIWMPEHFAYVSMVIAVIILASHYRQIHWFSGWVRREENMVLTCLKAPGFGSSCGKRSAVSHRIV